MAIHRSCTVAGDSFVGRDDELAAIASAFEAGAQLVSLLGFGGIGKTRIARESASEQRLEACFVDASECRSRDSLVARVATSLGIPSDASDEAVAAVLRRRSPLLLILDNLEQVVEAAAECLRQWRPGAPRVRFLTTSRMALGLAGEHRIYLRPLSHDDARALFVTRAREVDHHFETHDGDQALERLMQRLEGIPLAIELAAAQVRTLPLQRLAARLATSFAALRSHRRDVAGRQSTLGATLEWSWALLTEVEQLVLAQCSVFRGGMSLEAAEAVLDAGGDDALAVVQSLCDTGGRATARAR